MKIYSFSPNITLFAKSLVVFGQKNIINLLPTKQLSVHDTVLFTQNFTLLGKLQIKALR
jgi:hypothetical protein